MQCIGRVLGFNESKGKSSQNLVKMWGVPKNSKHGKLKIPVQLNRKDLIPCSSLEIRLLTISILCQFPHNSVNVVWNVMQCWDVGGELGCVLTQSPALCVKCPG